MSYCYKFGESPFVELSDRLIRYLEIRGTGNKAEILQAAMPSMNHCPNCGSWLVAGSCRKCRRSPLAEIIGMIIYSMVRGGAVEEVCQGSRLMYRLK